VPQVIEKFDSRKISQTAQGKTLTRLWLVTGTDDEDEVYQLLRAASVVVVGNMVRSAISADPLGGGVWNGTVEYSSNRDDSQAAGETPIAPDPEQTPGPETPLNSAEEGGFNAVTIGFDTSGGTAHVTQSCRSSN
jgi:hypothetical protein